MHFALLFPSSNSFSLLLLISPSPYFTTIANNSNPLCLTKIVGINAVLFAAFGLHVALMPFKNSIHNHLEAGSLVLNFALFDTALLASQHGDHMLALGWVLDIIRIVSVTVLVGYGVYENRAALPSFCTLPFNSWRRRQQIIAHSEFEDTLLTDEERDDSKDDDNLMVERQPGVEDEVGS